MIENSQITNNPEDIANILADKFAENSSDLNYTKEFLQYKQNLSRLPDTDEDWTDIYIYNQLPFNTKISMTELENTVQSSKNTSPGPDLIPNLFIKQLPLTALETLLKIYNAMWPNQLFPNTWHLATVIPILKSGKNKVDKNSYRPIALTCCLCKLLEKILNKRLRLYLESHNILHNEQSGFRENCSTVDCLANLQSSICNAMNANQHLLAVCLDLEKAYDLIWKPRILKLLVTHKIIGNMYYFIKNFLLNRTIKVRVGNKLSKTTSIDNGVPQGSVISVTLFLLCINDIINCISPPVK